MPLTRQEVEHIASLARLKLSDQQKERYRKQLEAILEHVAKLDELDTEAVPPTASVSAGKISLREDEVRSGLSRDNLLKNAPAQDDELFQIPPVFD